MQTRSKLPLPRNRQVELSIRRNAKMARSAHAYVRGNTVKFYEWLETSAGRKLPQGPSVWICGDCHVGNLGPVADIEGRVGILIRDLDQTVIGNPAHDLIRLGLSLATAARGSDLPGITTARMVEHMIEGYTDALTAKHRQHRSPDRNAKSVQRIMRQALRRRWRNLAKERIEDIRPAIPRGDRFWPLSSSEKREIAQLVSSRESQRLITALHSRRDDAKIELLDAAYWVKGCSSLGRLRYAALVSVGKGDPEKEGFCFLDIKEAATAAAPRSRNSPMPRDNAKRVVEGALHLAPGLGERMLAARMCDRSVVLRELMPQDLKLEIDQLTAPEAIAAARFLAMVVGEAHARQMEEGTRREWHSTLLKNRSKSLDAPSWLWVSIVQLVATHEAAYLDHCRRCAMQTVAA